MEGKEKIPGTQSKTRTCRSRAKSLMESVGNSDSCRRLNSAATAHHKRPWRNRLLLAEAFRREHGERQGRRDMERRRRQRRKKGKSKKETITSIIQRRENFVEE